MKNRRTLSLIYFAVLLLLMWLPLNGVVALDNFVFGLRADHLLHASVYLPCFYFLGRLAALPSWLLFMLSLCIGGITEGVQYLLPYRSFDVNDLLANAIGIFIGMLVFLFYKVKKNRKK